MDASDKLGSIGAASEAFLSASNPLHSFPTHRGGPAGPLHPDVAISLQNDNDVDNGPTVTGHQASSLFFLKHTGFQ